MIFGISYKGPPLGHLYLKIFFTLCQGNKIYRSGKFTVGN